MKTNKFQKTIISVEPTANYHKPLCEYLKSNGYLVVYVSSVAAKNNRKTINSGRWGKNDPRDAYNIVDLMRQGKILYYRNEHSQETNIRKYLMLRQRFTKLKSSLKTRIQNNIWACHFPELCSCFKNTKDPDVLTLLEHCPSSKQIEDMDFQSFLCLFPDYPNPKTKRYLKLYRIWRSARTSIGFPIHPATILEAKLIARDIGRTQKDITNIDSILTKYSMQNDSYMQLFSIPGYGPFTISVFKSVVGTIDNYSHHRQITKLAGIDIETMSSGRFHGKEKISKKGNSLLRFALCHATNVAILKNKIIRQMFESKLKERGGSRAAKAKLKIKFTDKLLRAAFYMLKNNVPFNINLFNVPVDDPAHNYVRAS